MTSQKSAQNGFTIVELLIVIVVIAILAAITITAYVGVTRSAESSALTAELRRAATNIEAQRVSTGVYPAALGLEHTGDSSSGYTIEYTANQATNSYCMTATSAKNSHIGSMYISNESGKVMSGVCPVHVGSIRDSVGIAPAPEACFRFISASGRVANYYKHQNNDTAQPLCPTKVRIPSAIGGVSVTDIALDGGAPPFLHGPDVVEIVVPSSVASFGAHAFYTTPTNPVGLTRLTVEGTISSVAANAFGGHASPVTSIIYKGMERISSKPLADSCYIFNSTTGSITGFRGGNEALRDIFLGGSSADCRTSELIIPSAIGGVAVTTIESGAFMNNNSSGFSGVVIPNSVTAVLPSAFGASSGSASRIRNSIIISSSVESIGNHAFYATGAKYIHVSDGALLGSVMPNSFAGISAMTTISIPATGDYGFLSGISNVAVERRS